MQRYRVEVNGNTYTVTVKSLGGNRAVVDVDGWEFQVGIIEGEVATDFMPIAAAAAQASMDGQSPPNIPAPSASPRESAPRKRSSALEHLSTRKASSHDVLGKGVVAAHLPGQIVEINVNVGDRVSMGDLLCKMEAMKMVNEVRSPIDGVVKEILIKESQTVLEHQPLMIID